MFFEQLGKLTYKHSKHYRADTATLNGNTRQCNTNSSLMCTVIKKFFNKPSNCPRMPYSYRQVNHLLWDTLSKARLKSLYAIVTACLSCNVRVQSFIASMRLMAVDRPLTNPCWVHESSLLLNRRILSVKTLTSSLPGGARSPSPTMLGAMVEESVLFL